jgi:hypothetical protein
MVRWGTEREERAFPFELYGRSTASFSEEDERRTCSSTTAIKTPTSLFG